MNSEVKYYISSDGTKMEMGSVETTHLSNGFSKKYRDIFNVTNKDEFATKTKELKDIQEEMYKRLNIFYETLGDNNGNTKK